MRVGGNGFCRMTGCRRLSGSFCLHQIALQFVTDLFQAILVGAQMLAAVIVVDLKNGETNFLGDFAAARTRLLGR